MQLLLEINFCENKVLYKISHREMPNSILRNYTYELSIIFPPSSVCLLIFVVVSRVFEICSRHLSRCCPIHESNIRGGFYLLGTDVPSAVRNHRLSGILFSYSACYFCLLFRVRQYPYGTICGMEYF